MTYEGAKLCVRRTDSSRWRRLPLREVRWLPERRPECVEVELDARGLPRPAITKPSYHRGRKPGNWGKVYPAEPLTSDEVRVLMGRRSKTAITGRRDRALLLMGWRCGARISELLALEHRDLDPERGSIRIRRGKGGKARTIGMDRQAWQEIQPWLDEHLRRFGPTVTVFCVATGPTAGRRLNATYVRSMMARTGREAGLTKHVHPHGLRHTAAVFLAGRMPMHMVQRQLGHSSLATTAVYLSGVANEELVDLMVDLEWEPQA